MLFFPLVQLLSMSQAIHATPLSTSGRHVNLGLENRDSPPPFKCMEGYELTAYTSTGINTCTKIAGSAILPGYSGQTVAVVGLISGLTGLMMGCLPVAKFFYRSGTGYFRQGQHGPHWNNAFPRDAIGNDSAVDYYPTDAMHQGWLQAFKDLQQDAYDPLATYRIDNQAETSVATVLHNGMNITHNVAIVPHNATHVTWKAHTDIVYNDHFDGHSKRDAGWTGGRVVLNNYPIDGVYHKFPISTSQAKNIADHIVARYIANIYTGTGSQICAYFGSEHTVVHESYAASASITSQVNYEGFDAAQCPVFWQSAIDPEDEL